MFLYFFVSAPLNRATWSHGAIEMLLLLLLFYIIIVPHCSPSYSQRYFSSYTKAVVQLINNDRNGSCLTWLATSLEEKRRWLIMNASPRGQCSK